MPITRVLLAVRPKMLAEVIRNMVERQPDMEVVGEVVEPIELLLVAGLTPADVAIIAPLNSAHEPRICRHLLAEYPDLRIVTLSGREDSVFVYASGSSRRRIDEYSESSVLDAMGASGNQG